MCVRGCVLCTHEYIHVHIYTSILKIFNGTNWLYFLIYSELHFLEILHLLFKVLLKMQPFEESGSLRTRNYKAVEFLSNSVLSSTRPCQNCLKEYMGFLFCFCTLTSSLSMMMETGFVRIATSTSEKAVRRKVLVTELKAIYNTTLYRRQ